jgi:hypothetical protein
MDNEIEEKTLEKKQKGMPSWASQPFKDYLDQLERTWMLLHLSSKGISLLRGIPRTIEVLNEVDKERYGDEERMKRAVEEAELAQKELDDGFPLLHSQFVVSLWSSMESLVRLFVARLLQNHKPAMDNKVIQRLQVKIGEYERLEGDDRYFYIVDKLEQELSTPLKSGVTRFEILLEPFGLSGPVKDEIRQDLFELNQVRNVVVHRSGIADRRFIDACPWLELKVGDKFNVQYPYSKRYFKASQKYVLLLIVRMGEYFGVNMDKFKE